MARYDYRCTSCENVFEVEHRMSEHPEVTCPKCGKKAERVFSTSGIVFSGSGFYNTDQRDKKERESTYACERGRPLGRPRFS